MNTEFIGEPKFISTDSIQANPANPRGVVEKDESFERLVSSIRREGILVPLVVSELSPPRGEIKYQLVDGERRFRAAKELGLATAPAHVLRGRVMPRKLRMLMFHLHMTREQWGAMAQCRSLADAYGELKTGVPLEEKESWVAKLREEAGMPTSTARDRVRVLSWPAPLKEQFFRFDEEQPRRNIYSYILALETSIVEPSVNAFPKFYNGNRSIDKGVNEVRAVLLEKTVNGIETGALRSREQIRSVSPLFQSNLPAAQRKTALHVFQGFIEQRAAQFDDVRAEITTQLPELTEDKPPKPQRVQASIVALTRTLNQYDSRFIDEAAGRDSTKRKLKEDFKVALHDLREAAAKLLRKF
jgi:hypothetical protein